MVLLVWWNTLTSEWKEQIVLALFGFFDDPRVGKTTREKYRKLYNSIIHTDWTHVFDVQRTFTLNYKTYQRIKFPLTPASDKSVWKGATVDRVVVDLSKQTRQYQIPHIH